MRGFKLNAYQRGLALDEYYKLLDYVEKLEQCVSDSQSVDENFVTLAQELNFLAQFGDNQQSVIKAFNQLQENYKKAKEL